MNPEPAGRVETHEGKEHRQDCLCHYEGESAQAGLPVPLLAGKWRLELAGGEIIDGAEAAAQLGVAQAADAGKGADKLDRGTLRRCPIAIGTGRGDGAGRIPPPLALRDSLLVATL